MASVLSMQMNDGPPSWGRCERSRRVFFMTYFEADLVWCDGSIAADGVGSGHGRRVDLGVGIIGRRRRVKPPASVVHFQPIEDGRAVDQISSDGAQTVDVTGQQRPQRHLSRGENERRRRKKKQLIDVVYTSKPHFHTNGSERWRRYVLKINPPNTKNRGHPSCPSAVSASAASRPQMTRFPLN